LATSADSIVRNGGRASEIGECVVDKRLLSGRSFEVSITRPVQLRSLIGADPAATLTKTEAKERGRLAGL
jgi:hypothetical protein